jgi:exonuclease III
MNMNHQFKQWKVLCWNVRGINAKEKWEDRISESNCDVICLQETKKQTFDQSFIKNLCPPAFDTFEFLPSVGASGGLIIIWKSFHLLGSLAFSNDFAISVDFQSKYDQSEWVLTNVYGPCSPEGKQSFLHWLKNIEMPEDVDWMIVGDFNLIRDPCNRNKPGGDANKMLLFNEVVSAQSWVENPLHGRKYTWSKKTGLPSVTKVRLVLRLILLDYELPQHFCHSFGHGTF